MAPGPLYTSTKYLNCFLRPAHGPNISLTDRQNPQLSDNPTINTHHRIACVDQPAEDTLAMVPSRWLGGSYGCKLAYSNPRAKAGISWVDSSFTICLTRKGLVPNRRTPSSYASSNVVNVLTSPLPYNKRKFPRMVGYPLGSLLFKKLQFFRQDLTIHQCLSPPESTAIVYHSLQGMASAT